jgi:hypothetical protein
VKIPSHDLEYGDFDRREVEDLCEQRGEVVDL